LAASPLETSAARAQGKGGIRRYDQLWPETVERIVLTGPDVILILKVAVGAVSIILAASIVALLRKNFRLHGRLNLVFMILTLAAVFGLEFLIRVHDPNMFDYFDDTTRRIMAIHLCFSVPAAVLLPIMYFTGKTGRRYTHFTLAAVFAVCWTGTFITGIFYLPHHQP
jgi:hypothetical protein